MGNTATRLARGCLGGLAVLWLVPAMLFNVDWGVGASLSHNVAAVGMILGAALFIHVGLARPHWFGTPVLMLVAFFMIYTNTKQAARNLGGASEAVSEAREARMAAGSHLASQRSRLETRRAAQVGVAGEAAVPTLEAALEALRVSEPDRWRLTKGCHPDAITKSADFCLRYAQAKAKVAAAGERDKIDAALTLIPVAAAGDGAAATKVADPYTANMIALLAEMGLRPTERLVVAEEAISRALGLELLAGFGPACWLIFLDIMFGAASVASRFRAPKRQAKTADAPASTSTDEPSKADAIDKWIADELEFQEGAVVFARQLRLTAGFPKDVDGFKENMIWARLRSTPGIKHDANNGRPRYFGVRIKSRLSLVSDRA